MKADVAMSTLFHDAHWCVIEDSVLYYTIFLVKDSGLRSEISESVRELLTEEVSTCNPLFPVKKVITRFLKRRTDHQQQCTATGLIIYLINFNIF